MKKFICLILLLSVLCLCACSSDKKTDDTTEALATGSPFELEDDFVATEGSQEKTEASSEEVEAYHYPEHLPAGYTEQQALEDRCIVLSFPEGELVPNISGAEHWESFLKAVESDADDARIRAVYFQNGIYYYTDLTYINGYFSMYTLNEFQNYEKAVGTYPYIKRIEGIEPNTGNEVCYYVLSELEDLTSEDVLDAARICDIETERGVPYEPIPFTQYGFDAET